MNYRWSISTGKIVNGEFLEAFVTRIFDDDPAMKAMILMTFPSITPPNVIDCIRYGDDQIAIFRYMELHSGCSIEEASKAVRQIKEDMDRIRRKRYYKNFTKGMKETDNKSTKTYAPIDDAVTKKE